MHPIRPGPDYPLYGASETRQLEHLALAALPPHTLMRRAGLAVARLALAIAPHARRIWIACGPGNNGGDGLEAAAHLQRWGKQTCVNWLGTPQTVSSDAAAAYHRALAAGVVIAPEPPGDFELCIDALLGLGAQEREPQDRMADWIQRINASKAMVLAVDVPSGLDATTGAATQLHVRADHSLSLLTLKPGLFTAQGRDASGSVWFDDLGVCPDWHGGPLPVPPLARLAGAPAPMRRLHAAHKGSFGDVAIVGGAAGMSGAALLAASAALHAGAGRVFVGLLAGDVLPVDAEQPELMFRPVSALDFSALTVVCGCGGGAAVRAILPTVLTSTQPVVIDADGLNAIAGDRALQAALLARSHRPASTVLTPHPLEAARLLGCTAAQVQHDRLSAAHTLSQRFGCTVVLKGSGTVLASPGQVPAINPTGNARLASAGTGDVLAGMLGALLAAGMTGFDAACHAVYRHGQIADQWSDGSTLVAAQLAESW